VCATISFWALPGGVVLSIPFVVFGAMAYPTIVLFWLGILCGFVGLVGILKYGRKGLLWKSLAGVFIPVFVFICAVTSFADSLDGFMDNFKEGID
tara:strand:+ start:1537 stop:1821 length:285 start_codon:yes stop_codon:yes gene_type:complete